LNHRGGNHKDDKQDQNNVNERDHVDFGESRLCPAFTRRKRH
jgi:hypothetical protein